MTTINIVPDPRILEVITHNPMPPVNALCELIDNSIDGFSTAHERGIEIKNPTIDVTLPSRSDISENIGRLVVRDNGPGLSKEEANDAIRAGFSGNAPIGRLGLFGMGFNISTGKLGKKTVFKTARREDKNLIRITINIPELVRGGTFDVPIDECPKPSEDFSGVEVEISDWWEEGNQNHGFIKKIVHIGVPKFTQQVGRRYSTLLRKKLIIRINNKKCPIFHHCAWASNRFVERRGHGRIPARFDFKEVLKIERRCYTCGTLIPDPARDACEKCKSSGQVKTRECTIKGWVGIQRFDEQNKFGLDFIRNGRAILIDEKDAVFTWTPTATGEKIKEYPVDAIYGRIIGEVHIDHVPTDFLKTDFQRTSPEWVETIKFLRGESCLLPDTQRSYNEPENDSPIYKLFQGYRRVRTPGRADMYMGYWDESKGGPSRISRDEEKELYKKFESNEPGYGPKDDSAWWTLVDRADIRPAPEMKECPNCGFQCLKDTDSCSCGHIFIAKKCIKCDMDIAQSSTTCPHCSASQVPEETREWVCSCTRRNPPDTYKCRRCGLSRGVEDAFKIEYLRENSNIVETLSNDSLSVRLPDGASMSAIRLNAYYLNPNIVLQKEGFRLPAIVHCFSNQIHVFLDQTHPLYNRYQDRPEDIISIEVAKWIWQYHTGSISDSNRHLWSLSNLYYLIHSEFWGKRVELDSEEVSKEVKEYFDQMSDALPELFGETAPSIYENMDEIEQSRVIEYLQKNNLLPRREELIRNGEFLKYLPEDMVVSLFKNYPGKFFDGKFWNEPYEKLDVPDPQTLERIKEETAGKYQRCLEDMIAFSGYRKPDINYIRKINQTLRLVNEYLA